VLKKKANGRCKIGGWLYPRALETTPNKQQRNMKKLIIACIGVLSAASVCTIVAQTSSSSPSVTTSSATASQVNTSSGTHKSDITRTMKDVDHINVPSPVDKRNPTGDPDVRKGIERYEKDHPSKEKK
jgi:hypothetical protein